MSAAGLRGSSHSLVDASDRSSVRSLGSTQYDAEAHQQGQGGGGGGGALGGFGLLLRQGVSQRLETQGQTIFFVAKVDKGGPAYNAGVRADDTLESVDGGKPREQSIQQSSVCSTGMPTCLTEC
jgi:C-terminal processing protease CtpA/Prc